MKRHWFTLFVALLLSALLFACSGGGDADTETDTAAETGSETAEESDAGAEEVAEPVEEEAAADCFMEVEDGATITFSGWGNETEQQAPEPVIDNLNVLIRRVSGASMEEIDRVILELQGVREMLRSEGERVGREIAGFASLSHAAMTAMKVIGDSLTQWKSAPNNYNRPAE